MDGIVSALIAAFSTSAAFKDLSVNTRANWRRHLGRVDLLIGDRHVSTLRSRDVRWLRDHFAATAAEANNTLRAFSSMLSWGCHRGWLGANPCLARKALMFRPRPYRAWPTEAIALLEREARPDLWAIAAVALYTGQRLGDCLRITWADARHGVITLRQSKTGKILSIPMHARLQSMWQRLPRAEDVVLTNRRGRAWTVNGFQASWRKDLQRDTLRPIRDADLVFHGLRKSAVEMLFDAGCSDVEVMAITGQSPAMIAHYAKAMDRRHLVLTAMGTWQPEQRPDLSGLTS